LTEKPASIRIEEQSDKTKKQGSSLMNESKAGLHIGNYRLLRLLGRGSCSEIYLGKHELFQTQAAIKLLQEQASEQEIEKFLVQAEVLSHLNHPSIVQVRDFGRQESTAFIVMDYAPFGTLRQRHPRGDRVALPTIASYIQQVAPALHYLHQHRLIHRDVKPHNMLLGANNHLMLNDFGTAVVSQSLDPIYATMHDFEGTVAYAAPEQLQGTPRRSSDQYGLGIVVYEWLCGEWPFSGSFDEVVHQHLFVPAPPIREKNPTLPASIEQVVMKALSKDPDDRYPSIEAFANALLRSIGDAVSQTTGNPNAIAFPVTPLPPINPDTLPGEFHESAPSSPEPTTSQLQPTSQEPEATEAPETPPNLPVPPNSQSGPKRQFLSPFPFANQNQP